MSQITILVGSMKKDYNTELLAKAFREGAKKYATVEILHITDYKVNSCIGCNFCCDSEGNRCFQMDSMTELYERLNVTDVLAIASPVYFYGFSSGLKTIIDRLHIPIKNDFSIKKLALLSVGAANYPELFEAIKLQYQLLLNYLHLENAGMVLAPGVGDGRDIRDVHALEEAFCLGIAAAKNL